jgi:hypothetical protein
MISLRTISRTLLLGAATSFTLAACDRASQVTEPTFGARDATFDRKVVAHPKISARVLINKAGVAVFEVRTGTFDNATNTGAADGYFQSVSYTIVDPANKRYRRVFSREIDFRKSKPTLYSEVINLCGTDNDHDDYDGHDHWNLWDLWNLLHLKTLPPCPLKFLSTYTVSVNADIAGWSGSNNNSWNSYSDDAASDSARVLNNPDLDLSTSPIKMVVAGPNPFVADLGLVQKATNQTYDVTFNNLGPAPRVVGNRATCEVHVFNGTTDVTPAGLTYRWIPNGRAAYAATKAGSAKSDTTSILPGDNATCEFTMALPDLGSYRIEVTAASDYPGDYDPSNNKVSGTVTIVAGAPSTVPPNGGGSAGVNATANEWLFYGDVNPDGETYGPFLGDSAQSARIDGLSATTVDGSNAVGTFTLKFALSTIDGTTAAPTATRELGTSTWTGSWPDLVAATGAASNHCVSSDAFGSVAVAKAMNNNVLKATICVIPDGANLKVAVNTSWSPMSMPAVSLSTANGATPFGDYVIWDTDLAFTGLTSNPVSHSAVKLTTTADLAPAGTSFGAHVLERRTKG